MNQAETGDFHEYQSVDDDTPYSLVSALRDGNEEAWNQLAKIWGRTIYQYCSSRNLKNEDCEEIVQAVLVKVYRYISQFQRDGRRMRLRHWVYAIVRNELATHCQRYLAKPASPGGEEWQLILSELQAETDSEDSVVRFRNQLVTNVMNEIQPDFEPNVWRAFEMFVLEEIDGPTVAKQLGMTPNAVRQAAHRVRTRLKRELEGEIDSGNDATTDG